MTNCMKLKKEYLEGKEMSVAKFIEQKIGEKAAEKRLEDMKWLVKKKFLGIPYS